MLKTEMINPKTVNIDKMDTASMIAIINEENMNAVKAVQAVSGDIEKAVDAVTDAFSKGGRLFYMGAGTSGRLGVMDAAECPPTFGVPKGMVVGIIAGGEKCLSAASENVEDSPTEGVEDLKKYQLNQDDVVVGLSVAGGAAYVVKALEYAKSVGATTVAITSNEGSPVCGVADIAICPDTGAEVITGSTRMKAGTAQKIILNMLSTCAMVKRGYVYKNWMINLKPLNVKLEKRMIGIVEAITGWNEETSRKALQENDWNIRAAVGEMIE
ncbi:MAG: N-acetylmuramic acid 6-phosphate etherase [Clostridia bacterium]|nr:N-acetylmuramic acid 6-phosphate etherase [Clostridia bacterium]